MSTSDKAERDPRVNPKPGDVITRMDGPTRVRATVIKIGPSIERATKIGPTIEYELTDHDGRGDPIYRLPLICKMKLQSWSKWASAGELLHVEE